ncbi:amino acid permease [Thermococcus siculi]|uniref:Amino acid permease n=1 Tax=Thermococcus siculi TaxID=72803 RepID=A0A2Z2MPT3_9EURY|nr:amino acid permease [Thermococcus siculi]ASJ08664.1 amino acid permease [Thermococcus siculi]
MRLVSLITSLLVALSFPLPWLRLSSGDVTFLYILDKTITASNGFEGAFWWLNPNSTGSIFTYVVFFAGLFMILLGVFFGLLGGRLGPGVGLAGMLLFTTVAWYIYGGGFLETLSVGYLLALGSFVAGFLLAGGKYL